MNSIKYLLTLFSYISVLGRCLSSFERELSTLSCCYVYVPIMLYLFVLNACGNPYLAVMLVIVMRITLCRVR